MAAERAAQRRDDSPRSVRHWQRPPCPGNDRWKLYDEKYLFQPTNAYSGKDGAGWLLSLRDYFAGRTAELDRRFDFLEKSGDEAENNIGWMLQPRPTRVSKQLWALLAVLLKGHDNSMRRFRNVLRHNGLRAWHVKTTPLNEDKAEVRRELLKAVATPAPASSVEGLENALEKWRTDKRFFTEADGKLPDAETMRLAFVAILPHEVYTYVSLHLDMEEYNSLMKVEKCVMKYAELLMVRRKP